MSRAKKVESETSIGEGEDPSLAALLAHVGGRIRELREVQNLSLHGFEEFTGIPFREIHFIETGKRNITVRTADKIARAIGVHTYELFIPRELSRLRPKKRRTNAAAKSDVPSQGMTLEALLAHIGGRIREIREMQNLPLPALEEFTDITPSELRRIEAGKRNITIKTADKIARAIGVHTYEFFIPRERSRIRAKRRRTKRAPDA